MISGLLTLLLLATATPPEAGAGLEALVTALAPESAQGELHFIERRESPLLEEPLTVSGQLWRDEEGRLVRQTVEPTRETQTLSAGMVVIERPGRSPRNFSLGHAPELAVLYRALTALLAGDAQALREHFEHELSRDGEAWQLRLRPRDDALADRVDALSLSGRDNRLERFTLSLVDGETVVTELSRQP
jgi:hypothetical protein